MVDCGSSEKRNRFVCPSDRQLALKAKLKTGWSVKTASLGYQGPLPPLKPEEQEIIVQVIKRAEQLDEIEQERVGKLVERLEQMRKNALGRSPTQCLLCGDGFGILSGQKAVCMDCRRLVCQKCAIENTSSRTHNRDLWLCMICAETREIWKKSGAWFFKGIPKYVLPGEKTTGLKKTTSFRSSKKGRLLKDDDSSSDEDRKMLTRRNSGTESTYDQHETSYDQNKFAGTSSMGYSRQTSSTDSQISKELEPLRNYLGSITLSEAKSWEGTISETKTDYASTEASEFSRRDSIVSRSMSDFTWTEPSSVRSDEKVSPGGCSLASNAFKPAVDQKSCEIMGSIELSLNYDPITATLHCTVYRAKNLIAMDINGLADPFCKLNILPNEKVSMRLRTKTVHKTRNPEFNENLTFYDITENDLMRKSLHVLVVDDDKYGHDYMGETRIPLAKLRLQNTVYLTLPLERLRFEQKGPLATPDLNQWFDDLWSRGQILLSLTYNTKRRALLVNVIRCANLLPMDNNGFSDPFVKLQLKPDPSHRKYKTSIKWKNLNPVFNEEFAFDTRPTELSTQSLFLTVWDKDYGKSNDYLGGLILGGMGSKGRRLKHWLDMIRYPDHRHEMWHNLIEDQIME